MHLAGCRHARPAPTAAPGGCSTEPRAQAIAARLGIGEAASAPMCLGCHATPRRRRAARASRSPTESAARAATAPPRAGSPAIMRSAAPTPPTSRAAWCRSTTRARAPPAASTAISAAPAKASSSTTGSWPPAIPGSASSSTSSRRSSSITTTMPIMPARKGRTDDVAVWAVGQAMALDRVARRLFANPRAAPRASSPNSISSTATPATAGSPTIPRFEPSAPANPGAADPVRNAGLQ